MTLKKLDLKKEFPTLNNKEILAVERGYNKYIDRALVKILSVLSMVVAITQTLFILYFDSILLTDYSSLLRSPRICLILVSVIFIVVNKTETVRVRGLYQSIIHLLTSMFSMTVILCITNNHPKIFISWIILMILTLGLLPIPLDKSIIIYATLFPAYLIIYIYTNGFGNFKQLYGFLIYVLTFGIPALLFKYYFFRPMKRQFLTKLVMQKSSNDNTGCDSAKESFSSFIKRYKITGNQARIIKLIFEGEVTHQGIAEKLNKSKSNVSSTLNRIYTKVGVSNQSELMLNIEHIYFD